MLDSKKLEVELQEGIFSRGWGTGRVYPDNWPEKWFVEFYMHFDFGYDVISITSSLPHKAPSRLMVISVAWLFISPCFVFNLFVPDSWITGWNSVWLGGGV